MTTRFDSNKSTRNEGRNVAFPAFEDDDLLPLPTDSDDDLRPLPTDPPPAARRSASVPLPEPEPEPEDDDSVIITHTSGVDIAALLRPEKAVRSARPRTRRESSAEGEVGYRFPYGRVVLEPLADETVNTFSQGTFQLRMVYHRGKASLPLFESTPLRPIAQITLKGQKYPVFLNQHSRKKRDRIVFGGKRKTARSARCLLRFIAFVEGREDKFSWEWRIGATAAAIAYNENLEQEGDETPIDEVALYLPFAPGKAQVVTQPDAPNVLALWMNEICVTVAAGKIKGVREGFAATPVLTFDNKGFALTLRGADLSGSGASLTWETWVTPARTEAEVRAALLRHAADIADRLQLPCPEDARESALLRLIEDSEQMLMREDLVAKRGADRQAYTPLPGDKSFLCGSGGDTALTCVALLARYYMTGDDAMRRRARLISRGVCDFQIVIEESPHWGAIWDANIKKKYVDYQGGDTVSVNTTARAAKGLHIAHTHFNVEILQRTALSAAQWLLLKMGMDGFMSAERFQEDGRPVEGTYSPWLVGEVLIPFVETFRVNQNEVFLKVALRSIAAVKNGLESGLLRYEQATAEQLASAIEGILLVSREYESEEMIALAKRLMAGLRVRRQPDGSFGESPLVPPSPPLVATLAGCRAALALTRVDDDPLHLLTALRAIRAAGREARAMTARGEWVNIAAHTGLLMHSIGVLLAVVQRAKNFEIDRDRVVAKRGWQTFAPDPATREYIQVSLMDGSPVDYITLVDQVSLQVLIAVIAPPDAEEVRIIKNGRTPFLRGVLDGSYEMRAKTIPLGDGSEARIGVFIADT